MDNRLPLLAGPRVLLREPRPADAERLFAYTSDPEVTRFLAFDPPRSVGDSLRFIARAEALRACDVEYVFTIADRFTDAPARHHGTAAPGSRDGHRADRHVGAPRELGSGREREAKVLLLGYAFGPLGLHRIEARIALENRRSRNAFVKLGGRFEGTLRQSFRKNGAILDQGLYAILAPEWRGVPPHGRRRGARCARRRRAWSMADLAFFYGTLMTGFDRRRRIGIDPQMTFRARGWVQAALFDLGIYPAAVPAENGRVWGEVFELLDAEDVLRALDEIEGYRPGEPDSSLYVRSLVPVHLPDGTSRAGVGLFLQRPAGQGAAHRFRGLPGVPEGR